VIIIEEKYQPQRGTGKPLLVNFDFHAFLIGVLLLAALLPLVWRRSHKISTLFFFSIFWLYLLVLVKAVVFPIFIQTGEWGAPILPAINLVPFYFGPCFQPQLCLRGILENILMTIPFGFGINFLARLRPRRIYWLAPALGLILEASQLVLALVFRSGFHTVDINDVILNATGVLLGYAIFRVVAWGYLRLFRIYQIKPKGLWGELHAVFRQTRADT
jgi:glycopeptide antibiotics resistance protein